MLRIILAVSVLWVQGIFPAISQAGVTQTVTRYTGNLYEEEVTPDGKVRKTKHIYLGDMHIADEITDDTGTRTVYFHGDHLGGTNVVTDEQGQVVKLTEYEPYGQMSRNEEYTPDGQKVNKQYTGKELDESTGLYYYGARYYNPWLGRFITPDTIVQDPTDPQTLNRYSYTSNNPVNRIDPDGHSWWKKLWGAIKNTLKYIHNPVEWHPILHGIATGNWSYVKDMAVSGATGFIFGGPIGAATAMATMAVMRTPIAKFYVETRAQNFFDNVLGMSPRTAYVVASVETSTALSLGFERAFANLVADPVQVNSNLADAQIENLRENGQFVGDENIFGPSLKTKGAFESKGSIIKGLEQNGKLVGSYQKTPLDIPFFKQIGAHHSSANVLTVSSSASKLNPWKYATWGTCHQATNATLLSGGISSTVLDLGPSWDMFVTTAVYGNYGGQLGNRALSGVNANRNHEGK